MKDVLDVSCININQVIIEIINKIYVYICNMVIYIAIWARSECTVVTPTHYLYK